MQGNKKLIAKIQSWREKAKNRNKIIINLRKWILEIIASREMWRSRYYNMRKERNELAEELKCLKQGGITKIAHHSYTAEQIGLCLQLRHEGGCSYRSCVKVLMIISNIYGFGWRKPSPSSVRDWDIKFGYDKIQQTNEKPKDYVLILDESVSIGSQKLLLFLGVESASYQFDKALTMEQVEVLDIKLKESWKGPEISESLQAVNRRNFLFKYSCNDNGSNLRNALTISNIIHIEDCGHALGNILEKKYKKDEIFLSFSARFTKFKRQIFPSKFAEYSPPKQRTKGRFMNLSSVSKWTIFALQLAQKYKGKKEHKEIFSKLKWVLAYAEFIEELNKEQGLIDAINKILKKEGLSKETLEKCEVIIQEAKIDQDIQSKIKDYLKRNFAKIAQIKKIICSSDIIESIFGKFKQKLCANPQAGMTPGCLTIANYGRKITPCEIKQAMQRTRIIDIQKWRKKNLPISIAQKKKMLVKSMG